MAQARALTAVRATALAVTLTLVAPASLLTSAHAQAPAPAAKPAAVAPRAQQSAQPAPAQPASAQPASAQPAAPSPTEARARTLFLEGIELSKQEHWAEALTKFEQSWSLVPRPNTMFNIASVLVRMQRFARATDAFERYLKLSDPVKDKPSRVEAERQLADARLHLGTLALELRPENADVRVNGAPTPNTGALRNLRLDEGTQVLHVSAPGYQPRELQVPIKAGTTDRLGLELLPALAATPAHAAPLNSSAYADHRDSGGGLLSSPVFWAITGVVLASAAVTLTLIATSDHGTKDPYGGQTGVVLGALK